MYFIKLFIIASILFLVSSCNSNLDVNLFFNNKKSYFLNTKTSYGLSDNLLDIAIIDPATKIKYPSAIIECSFTKDSDMTIYPCSNLAPSLNYDNNGHFNWSTNYSLNGEYSFEMKVSYEDKVEIKKIDIVVNNANRAPSMSIIPNQVINEDHALTTVIPIAVDLDGDALSYSCLYTHELVIDQDCSDLGIVFNSITGSVDWTPTYPNSGNYIIKINAMDGLLSTSQSFTINVRAKPPFITEWKTTTSNEVIRLPLDFSYSYDFKVDWGDGSPVESVNSNLSQHIYNNPGNYTVVIRGQFPASNFDQGPLVNMALKLIKVVDLGDVGWKSLSKGFYGANNLISFKGGVTSEVQDMSNMFVGTRNLIDLDVSSFDTSKVTDMSNMFSGVEKIKNLDLQNFDTSKVQLMSGMFNYCLELETLNISSFNTSNVYNMEAMFANLRKLQALDVSHFDTSHVNGMANMFYNMYELKTLNLANFETSNVATMLSMFENMKELISLDVSNFDTSEVRSMAYMFSGVNKLATLNLTHFSTVNVREMNSMFRDMHSLVELDLSNFNTPLLTTTDQMFADCRSLTSLVITNLNTSNVTNMSSMFSNMKAITTLNLSSFNTSKLQMMSGMFYGMNNLSALNIKHFDTSKVISMAVAFYGLSLSELDLSIFDTSNVQNMTATFSNSTITKLLLYGKTTADPLKDSWDLTSLTESSSVFHSSYIDTYCYGSVLGKPCNFDPLNF